jgi:hypothetical protein
MELGSVLILKLMLASSIWTIGWVFRFAYTGAEPNRKNLLIAFGPWILMLVYFFLFWWG